MAGERKLVKACVAVIVLAVTPALRAATIWTTGPGDVTFNKPSNSDETDPAFWDKITNSTWITRGNTKGLYNAKTETFFNDVVDPAVSPANTEWAFSGLEGNPTFGYGDGAAQYLGLTFDLWEDSLGGTGSLASNIQTLPGVLHIISDDIYIDIQFSFWQQHPGGGFTYLRAAAPTATPEPGSLAILVLGAGVLGLKGRAGRRR